MNGRGNVKRIIAYILAAVTAGCLLASCQESVPAVSDGFGRVPGESYNQLGNAPATDEEKDDRIAICVDPGHGFGDVGTTSAYLGEWSEKDVTFSIATMLKEELEARGYRVHMLHDGVTIPANANADENNLFRPKERIESIRDADIDYYVSIHCDAYAADESVMGTRVYYANGTSFTKKSKSAAGDIKNAINDLLPDAKAQADKLQQDAEYLKQKRINEAHEQVAMFEAMYAEYAQNPAITRSRMYYEAISKVLPDVKLYINASGEESADVQMLLPLESLVNGGN